MQGIWGGRPGEGFISISDQESVISRKYLLMASFESAASPNTWE